MIAASRLPSAKTWALPSIRSGMLPASVRSNTDRLLDLDGVAGMGAAGEAVVERDHPRNFGPLRVGDGPGAG
jgi:hypothetical protein